MAQTKGNLAESGIGQDERSILLGTGPQDQAGAMGADFSLDDDDPTQQLLLALGQFQRILKGAQEGANDLWSDECMNQLILGVEISLSQSWSQLVDAFTDAGRILQTYESASRARDALPFLDGAYDLLCGIVGEVMGGGVRPQVLDKWQVHYAAALAEIKLAGLTLVDDNEVDASPPQVAEATETKAKPFPFPRMAGSGIGDGDDELPTLDELPPLEDMLPSVQEDAAPREDELGESIEEDGPSAAVAETDPGETTELVEPSKVVVDIVDRICDELAELNDRSPENRVLAMEMIEGGVSALKREADTGGFTKSSVLCDVMKEACSLVGSCTESLDERFTEICFAFCGVFIEAMGEAESDNVIDWHAECNGLIAEWTPSDTPAVADAPKPIEEDASEPVLDEAVGPEVWAPPAAEAAPIESGGSISQVGASDSQALFERAQKALASGDAETAKVFALQAAAAIASAEVVDSERVLQECEIRLKASLNATVEARGAVKEAEKMVKSGASQVSSGERSLGEAKERTAAMDQELSEEEERIVELDAEIAEMQSKREEAGEKVTEATTRLNEARGNESSVSERLDGLRSAETVARKTLEGARQHVKDHQRTATEVEARMEKSREALTKHKMSFEDIRQTIGEAAPQETAAEDESDEMLF